MSIPLPPLPFGWWKDKVSQSEMEHFIHTHAAAVSAAKDARIKVLEDQLRLALTIIGHPDDDITKAMRAALGDKTP